VVLLFTSSHHHFYLCVLNHQQGTGGSSKRKAEDDAHEEAPQNRRQRRAPQPDGPPSPGAASNYLQLGVNTKPDQQAVLDSLTTRKESTLAKNATHRETTSSINKQLTALDVEGGLLQVELDNQRLMVQQKMEEVKQEQKELEAIEDTVKDNESEKKALRDELAKLDLDKLQWESDRFRKWSLAVFNGTCYCTISMQY